MNRFQLVLGSGRGRRPVISSYQVDQLIEDLEAGQETIAVEQAIGRNNISEVNRQRLRQALGSRRFRDQAKQIEIVAKLTGILPKTDSQGLLNTADRKMHRWPGHWHSGENLLMAPTSLKSQTNCGLKVRGGDSEWQPLGTHDWDNRPSRQCPKCATVSHVTSNSFNHRLTTIATAMSQLLGNKAWPEAHDLISLRQDPWRVVMARVLHPLDGEEVTAIGYSEQEIEAAWLKLASEALAQRPLSQEATAARALAYLHGQG